MYWQDLYISGVIGLFTTAIWMNADERDANFYCGLCFAAIFYPVLVIVAFGVFIYDAFYWIQGYKLWQHLRNGRNLKRK